MSVAWEGHIHGLRYTYTTGCRCESCTDAMRAWERRRHPIRDLRRRIRFAGRAEVRHDGIFERRHPDLVLAWIRGEVR